MDRRLRGEYGSLIPMCDSRWKIREEEKEEEEKGGGGRVHLSYDFINDIF